MIFPLHQTGKSKEKGPSAADHKLKMRGRSHQKVIAKDHTSPKAIQKGEKLILATKQVVSSVIHS
jgi:hypothetical protein